MVCCTKKPRKDWVFLEQRAPPRRLPQALDEAGEALFRRRTDECAFVFRDMQLEHQRPAERVRRARARS